MVQFCRYSCIMQGNLALKKTAVFLSAINVYLSSQNHASNQSEQDSKFKLEKSRKEYLHHTVKTIKTLSLEYNLICRINPRIV